MTERAPFKMQWLRKDLVLMSLVQRTPERREQACETVRKGVPSTGGCSSGAGTSRAAGGKGGQDRGMPHLVWAVF